MKPFLFKPLLLASAVLAVAGAHPTARADAVTDWNQRAGEWIVESKLGTPPAVRVMALVQTAVDEALRDPRAHGAAEVAVAAANRAMLSRLLPAQQAAIDAAYKAVLAKGGDGAAQSAAATAGERAADKVLAARADDAAALATPDTLRPHASAGAYVPTAAPAASAWPRRKPWLMDSVSQFRPAAPPALSSETWARDLEEVKALGGKVSSKRTAEQTEIARFWDFSLPPVYHGVLRSVAQAPGRDLAANARLFATAAQAMDDAVISVFEAKYHYNFWRPVTAIRNADIDGNDATVREPGWASLIDTPMHPEYPSAHAILAATVGTVIDAEFRGAPLPVLSTYSPTGNNGKGATRQWQRTEDFIAEVAVARVYDGVHYRFSSDVGVAMGRALGRQAVARRQPGAGAGQ